MNMRTFETLADLIACVGREICVSNWLTITQQRIDRFAEATEDHQWIHVDAGRAANGPFGCTIAHGFLTLSLIAGFSRRTLHVKDVEMGINYGLNKVRFTAPVPVGSRLRMHMGLLAASPVNGGQQLTWHNVIEREGHDKPVCVAESLARYYISGGEKGT